MSQDEKKSRKEELDRIWDIDSLIPKRSVPPVYTTDTSTAEIVIEATDARKNTPTERIPKRENAPAREESAPRRRFIPPHTEEELLSSPKPEEEYTPENALLHKVRLYRHKSNYPYYESFLRDAVRLYPIRGERCARVPFFSYVPQYSQMNRPQLEWYLWWREQFRKGEYVDTDYSYLLLFAYELIHLATKIDPLSVRDGLCRLWEHYREVFHQLDSYLPEWICDCCLIHRLPPPQLEGKLLGAAMSHCNLKEFYLISAQEDGYLRALLLFCSNYDYHRSKFCTEQNAPLFERTVFGALGEISRRTGEDGKPFSKMGLEDSRMVRDAYMGALCASRIKRRIEVEYCSFSRAHELRFLITDVIKYTENAIRASLGVRSRLTVYALPTEIRGALDAYLGAALPTCHRTPQVRREEMPDYEKLYDLPSAPLSFEAAAQIEKTSWETTRRLVEAFEGEDESLPWEAEAPLVEPMRENVAKISVKQTDVAPPSISQANPYRAFLLAVKDDDAKAQLAAARAVGKPAEVLADEINALCADRFGDILLEENGSAYALIEEYADWLEELLASSEDAFEA